MFPGCTVRFSSISSDGTASIRIGSSPTREGTRVVVTMTVSWAAAMLRNAVARIASAAVRKAQFPFFLIGGSISVQHPESGQFPDSGGYTGVGAAGSWMDAATSETLPFVYSFIVVCVYAASPAFLLLRELQYRARVVARAV